MEMITTLFHDESISLTMSTSSTEKSTSDYSREDSSSITVNPDDDRDLESDHVADEYDPAFVGTRSFMAPEQFHLLDGGGALASGPHQASVRDT